MQTLPLIEGRGKERRGQQKAETVLLGYEWNMPVKRRTLDTENTRTREARHLRQSTSAIGRNCRR